MATVTEPRAPGSQLGLLERIPWRRIILVVLSVLILLVVVVGSYKTLTLPADERYTGTTWKNFVTLGLAQGAIIALIALGYTLVYGILRMINFAHGEVFMFGAYTSFFFSDAWEQSGFLNSNPWLSMALLILIAMTASMIVALLLERIAYRPLRNAPRLVPLITAIGASLFLSNTARGFFGAQSRGYGVPDVLSGSWTILGVQVNRIQLLVLITVVVSVVALSLFVSRTRTGKSMRAVAADGEIASLMGIQVDRVIVITFAIGGLLAGVAAVLFSITFESVSFTMGFRPGIAAFTAAVLGGIGSIYGAALGGVLLGLLQSVGPALILTGYGIPSSFQLKDAFTFLVLVLVLIFRPGGLLGSGEAEKV
jgi:branched-chain amino acid transport system permease protein